MKRCMLALTLVLFATCFTGGYAYAQTVAPGVDLFETPPGGLTEIDVNLPAGFFEPGSDPFIGTIELRGKALEPADGPSLGRACTVVERLAPAALSGPGSSETIPIEIVALRLVSVQPITVLPSGDLWDVGVSLSCDPQLQGTMTIYQEYDGGGTYEASLPVTAKLTFTRRDDGMQVHQDPLPLEIMETPPIPLPPAPAEACWSYGVEFPIVESDGTTEVDTDCGPKLIGPSSNFVAGGCGFIGPNRPGPGQVADSQRKVTSQEQAAFARHGVQPANPLDHFKVYDVVPPIPWPGLVTLKDQFDQTEVPADLVAIERFANPVSKNGEGIGDLNAHLMWYRITAPAIPYAKIVTVDNQFGLQQLEVAALPEYLLVPAEKVELGSDFPYMLDHYKVYRVIKGPNVDQTGVTLDDQFHSEIVDVKTPAWFANPVDKNGEGIIDEVDHLVFYRFTPRDVPPVGSVETNDQFGNHPIVPIDSSRWLGVPSDKVEVIDIIPTLSTLGMIVLALLLVAAAVFVLRRRRLAQSGA